MTSFYYLRLPAGHGMEWNGMENEMEWNGNFGMEYGRCQNGMDWKISRMEWEDNLPYFHINSILDFVHCIYRKNTYRCREVININCHRSIQLQISTHYYLSTNRGWLCTLRKHCTYCIFVSTLQFNCSSDDVNS